LETTIAARDAEIQAMNSALQAAAERQNQPPEQSTQPQLAATVLRLEAELQAMQLRQQHQHANNHLRPPKPQAPQVWDGVSDFRTNYEISLEAYFNRYGNAISGPESVDIAMDFLSPEYKAALHSYFKRCLPDQRPQNFRQLCELLRAWLPQGDRTLKSMAELYKLKQKQGQLAEYTRTFNVLMLDLNHLLTDWFMKWKFVEGLTASLQGSISGKYDLPTCTLQHIVNEATSAEGRAMALPEVRPAPAAGWSTYRAPASVPPPVRTSASFSHSSASGGPVPMELNAAGFAGVCHNCGRLGHKRADCPHKQQKAGAAPSGQQHSYKLQRPAVGRVRKN
jgi:hypothetical protein